MRRGRAPLSLACRLIAGLGLAGSCGAQFITSLTPVATTAGAAAFTLTVKGTGFYAGDPNVPKSTVEWNGATLTTTFVNTTQLNAAVPASLISASGNATIRVRSPFLSNELTFVINPAPVISTFSTVPAGAVAKPYSMQFDVSDGTGPFMWSLIGGTLPPGLTLTTGGKLSGTPTKLGDFEFTLRVQDAAYMTSAKLFYITIYPEGPRITTDDLLPDGVVGTRYSKTFQATGGTAPYVWSVWAGGNPLPPGLSLSSGGVLSGTPTVAGAFDFQIRVSDRYDKDNVKTFALTIDSPPFEISTASPLPLGVVGVSYVQTLTAKGGVPPYRWYISAGNLPAGLSVSADGVLSGTPTTAGTFEFTVRVLDNTLTATERMFSLRIGLTDLDITTDPELPKGIEGDAYSQALRASGGSPPYAWSIVSGSPPPGVSLSGSGVLSGTLTKAGVYNFTVQVTDSAKYSVTAALSLAIDSPTLRITTARLLPKGTAGIVYSMTLVAVSGELPYGWTLLKGALPPGLTMSSTGIISGVPSRSGTYRFTVQVRDKAQAIATQTFDLQIVMPPLSAMDLGGMSATVDPAEQPVFTLNLASPYPLEILGTVRLTVRPATNPLVDDPAIQFPSGGRVLNFAIPAGQTEAVFPSGPAALQTGTVAGTITLTVNMQAAGQNITPSPAPAWTFRVNVAPPVITSINLLRTASGYVAEVTGYATPRQIKEATFRFEATPGYALGTGEVTVNVENAFTNWYQSAASAEFGSTFRYTQPFTVQGHLDAVSSVTVTLANGQGVSAAVQRRF